MTETNFRPMRRKRQQLPMDEARRILEQQTSGVLSLIGDEGYPYGVPISYVLVNDELIFHSALAGHKVDAIRKESKACFTVIAKDDVKPHEFTTYFRSAIAFGRIRILEDEQEKYDAIRALAERYNPGEEEEFKHEMAKDFSRTLLLKFKIEHLSGKEAIELVRQKAE